MSGLASGEYTLEAYPPPGNTRALACVDHVPAGERRLVLRVERLPVTFYLEDFDRLKDGESWGLSLLAPKERANPGADTEGYLVREWTGQPKIPLDLSLGMHQIRIWKLGPSETPLGRKDFPGNHPEIWLAPDSKREFLVRWEGDS